MILKRRVALDGVYLDQVDSRILISRVEPAAGVEDIGAVDIAGRAGQRITGRHRATQDVAVGFRIREFGRSTAGMEERAEVLEKATAWAAAGGYLTVNYKPGRRMRVVLAQEPAEGSLWDYTKEFLMTFRAYRVPYWEDAEETTYEFDEGTGGTGEILIGGSAETQAEIEIENVSGGVIDSCTVSIGGKTMVLSGIALTASETLAIEHMDGLVRIYARDGISTRSLMAKRTGAGDFLITPGYQAVSFSTDGDCWATVKWRNRYL